MYSEFFFLENLRQFQISNIYRQKNQNKTKEKREEKNETE